MVALRDVLEVVNGVAPPDSYYHALDQTSIHVWQRAVARVALELERLLGDDV